MNAGILRIIDANLNRAREGLRVCEEVARFILNSRSLTGKLKNLRHRVRDIYNSFPEKWKATIGARNSKKDVGRHASPVEMKRRNPADVFYANLQRTKESLRVLEEFLKLSDNRTSNKFKRLRFDLYEIEKKALKKL